MHPFPGHLGQQALESYLWGAANLLRGLIDAGDYKQYVFPLLFFKRLSDVWDEDCRNAFDETGDRGYAEATANDRFIIPAGAHWSDVRLAAVPEDELGNAYEYLIKQFADDSGHTAQEFYTNRTLVHLMTRMLRPRPGERICDPTAGTGGMLISAATRAFARSASGSKRCGRSMSKGCWSVSSS